MFVETSRGDIYCTVNGSGPSVILIHGFGSSSAQWELCIKPIVDAGMQAITIDLPGFGRSYLPDKPISALSYRHTLLAVMDALGLESASLVGSSMGGLVSWLVAANAPERVRSLVLVSPSGAPDEGNPSLPARSSKRQQRGRFGSTQVLFIFGLLSRMSLFDPLTRRLLSPVLSRLFGEIPVSSESRELLFQAAKRSRIVFKQRLRMESTPEPAALLQNIQCPTLLVWGDQDKIIPLPTMDFFVEHLPHARIKVYFGAGHVPMLEIPEEFTEDVSLFLKNTILPGGTPKKGELRCC